MQYLIFLCYYILDTFIHYTQRRYKIENFYTILNSYYFSYNNNYTDIALKNY